MINLFVAILFACMCSEYFYIYFQVSTLNDVVENMPLAVVANSLFVIDEPEFNEELLRDNVLTYYQTSLGSLYNKCEIPQFEYYGLDENGNRILTGKNTEVDITLNCAVASYCNFSKTMTYSIRGGI
ncbi:MAG: hypothetical protein LUC16_02850 [Coprobacillus sp.]|nr:hypothetical protein [Coprobacillus sp.]